jgi:hypothetical protein
MTHVTFLQDYRIFECGGILGQRMGCVQDYGVRDAPSTRGDHAQSVLAIEGLPPSRHPVPRLSIDTLLKGKIRPTRMQEPVFVNEPEAATRLLVG